MTVSHDCPTAPSVPLRYDELALRVVGSEHHGRILRIQSAKCTIGSAPGCTVRLRAPGVQAVHCLVLRGPGGLAVRSWSAETRLNGHTFDDAHLLPGDRLAVGPVELEIVDPGTLPDARSLPLFTESAPTTADIVRLKELEAEALAAAAARDALAARVEEHDQHVARLCAQLAEAERLVEQLRRDLEEAPAASTSTATDEQLATLQAHATSLSKDLAATQAALAADQADWQVERADLVAINAQVQEELVHLKAANEREHARLTAELEKAAHAAAANVEKQRELREMEVAMTHWRERTEEQALQIAELESRLAELQSQQTDETSEQQKIRDELEAGARELDAETERLIAKEETLEKRLQAWEAEQREVAEAITAQRTRFEEQAAELALQQEALAAAQLAWQEQQTLRGAEPTFDPDFSIEREELSALATELDTRRAELEHREQRLQASETQQREVAVAISAQRAQLEAQAAALACEQEAWQEQQQFREAETVAAEDFNAQRAELAALAIELEGRRAELEIQEQCLQEQRGQLADAQAALRDEQVAFANQQADSEEADLSSGDAAAKPAEVVAEAEPETEPAAPYEAPSASDIIAKLSASGLWKDDVPADTTPEGPQRPEPAWKALVPEQPVQKPAPAATPVAEEEDSIEAYMQRLLKRVSGDNEPAPKRFTAENAASFSEPKQVPEPVATSSAAPEPEVDEEPFDFQTYVPRSAPELTANLAAMRELANSSARKAIDTSSKRRQAKHATSKVVLALGAIGTAVALGWLSMQTKSVLSYYAALSAGVASLLWGMHAGYLCIKARQARQSDKEDE